MLDRGYENSGYGTRLMAFGQMTEAAIISTRIQPKSTTDPASGNWYFLDYHFRPAGQNTDVRVTNLKVSPALFSRYQHRKTLPVTYLPDAPQINSPEPEWMQNSQKTTAYLGGALALLGGGLLISIVFSALKALKARNSIQQIINTKVTAKPRWKLFFYRLEYQLGAGESHRSFMMLDGPFNRIKIGDTIQIALTDEGPYWSADLQLKPA